VTEVSLDATVLVVDDEEVLRGNLARRLAKEGYRVLEAGNGREAMQLVDDAQHDIRLVVTDIRMPVMNGYELADRLTMRPDPMPMIFISGYRQSSIALPGPVFMKPFNTDHLLSEIRRLVGARAGKP
jgi:two-component system, cell cycle sensor histidine kinase and response regulator CckA